MTTAVVDERQSIDISSARLWVGVLVPPLTWAVHGGVSYLVAREACQAGAEAVVKPTLFVISIVAFIVCVVVAIVAYLGFRRIARRARLLRSDAQGRHELMAMGGIFQGIVFAIAVFWNWLPVVILHNVCEAMR